MEFLLLWIDEMDDAFGALRHLAPRALGLIATLVVLFCTAGLGLVFAPHVTLSAVAVALSAALFQAARRRRMRLIADRDQR